MSKFKPSINVAYPPGNTPLFEEWMQTVWEYKPPSIRTDREILPVNFTSYHVNNGYGKNEQALRELQEFVDSLDRGKKWFSICQYDDSVLIDFKDLDVMRFEMSKNIGTPLPLMCQPHPYQFSGYKKYLASFVGSRTHPVRKELEKYKGRHEWYISFEPHSIEDYCRILHESVFALCPRGYGANSFRIAEAIQYGAIPVYISDEFIEPFGVDFNTIGVKVLDDSADSLYLLESTPITMMAEKAAKLPSFYKKYYTYEGCMERIIHSLETEYHQREQNGAA